jgi:fatty-acyl-CoA synthase
MQVYPERVAVVDDQRSFTYAEFGRRSLALTGMLAELGVRPGDRVAALCSNSHVMLELHNGVPLLGAVLVPLNTRLSVSELGYIVDHSGARLLVATGDLADRAAEVAADRNVPLVIEGEGPGGYETLLAAATSAVSPAIPPPHDERGLLAINYTSGTTGRPKGVMYHHRGAYLQALAMAYHARLSVSSRYLWTLPMFHCNGWCFTWGVTAAGATHVCLRSVDAERIWGLLRDAGVTHLSGAPAVLRMIGDAPSAAGPPLEQRVHVDTGGAPPTPALLRRLEGLNLSVQHLYGLTESFGPVMVNDWHPEWDDLGQEEVSRLKARQGVGNVIATPVRVVDAEAREVPADGSTVGEIALSGNDVMLGYYRDADATSAAVRGGWFHTGDLAVRHPDGYVEIVDRSKDVIITGGENVASVEVERVLDAHPDVAECAVVGVPDERWGEAVTAYVVLRPGSSVGPDDLRGYVREHLAGFKVPKRVVFDDIPKTSTGKVQKHILRDRAQRLH